MKSFFSIALIFMSLSLSLVVPSPVAGSAAAQITSQDSPQNRSPQPPPPAAVPPAQPAPDASLPQTQTSTPSTPPQKTKPAYQSSVNKSSVKKPRAKTKTQGTPSGKVVVKNGGARDTSGQISPGISAEQESHQRETTSQLLATTDANLKKIAGRPLTSTQQNMLEQIHSYLNQAKTAANARDVTRAHTLAFKAHLLSDELTRK